MSQPILVIADVHGNLEALKAVLKDARGKYGEIWMLGDIVGYGPDPGPCLDTLKKLGAKMVAGNHDRAACGMLDIEDFNPEAKAAIQLHQAALEDEQRQFLAELPEILMMRSVTLAHGRPDNPIWGYVLDDIAAMSVLKRAETSLTLIGHSHLPGLWAYDSSSGVSRVPAVYGEDISYAGVPHLANPGSVGQSRNGDYAALYILLHPEKKTLKFCRSLWKRNPTRRKMVNRGYPPSLIERMAPPD